MPFVTNFAKEKFSGNNRKFEKMIWYSFVIWSEQKLSTVFRAYFPMKIYLTADWIFRLSGLFVINISYPAECWQPAESEPWTVWSSREPEQDWRTTADSDQRFPLRLLLPPSPFLPSPPEELLQDHWIGQCQWSSRWKFSISKVLLHFKRKLYADAKVLNMVSD